MAQKITKYTVVSGPETPTLPVGATPSAPSDLVTIQYLQDNYSNLTEWSASVDDITALKAIAAANRSDQQVRVVESQRGLWQFESGSSATGDDYFVATPASGTGRWISLWNRFKDFTASFWVQLKIDSGLTADRVLTVDVNDSDRTIDLGGNLTVSSASTISGTNTGDVDGVIGTQTNDAATTGANAELPQPTTQNVAVTNASLTSIDMIVAPSSGTRAFILINKTGGAISLNNETGATAARRIRTGTGVAVNIEDEASITLAYDTASLRWQVVGGTGGGSGGGGGGSGIIWNNSDGGPLSVVEFNAKVYKFEDGAGQTLYGEVIVPSSYLAGSPIVLNVKHYHQGSPANQLLTAVTTLIQSGDAIDSTTNQRTSTNTAVFSGTKSLATSSLDLSSSIGEINAVAIVPGDVLRIALTRGSDSSTADMSVIESSMEVTFT